MSPVLLRESHILKQNPLIQTPMCYQMPIWNWFHESTINFPTKTISLKPFFLETMLNFASTEVLKYGLKTLYVQSHQSPIKKVRDLYGFLALQAVFQSKTHFQTISPTSMDVAFRHPSVTWQTNLNSSRSMYL